MTDLLEGIMSRRSIHSFRTENVNEETLKQIFTYATWAPTHYMKEAWNIKLYQDKGKDRLINAIMDSYQRLGMIRDTKDTKTIKMVNSMKQFLRNIPHHAVIYFNQVEDPIRYEEEYASVCAFIQNAQLAAWEYGVGMLWTITPYMHDPEFSKAIGLDPDQIKIAAVLQIGYPHKVPTKKGRTPIEVKMQIITE